jgi:hypothetical protein
MPGVMAIATTVVHPLYCIREAHTCRGPVPVSVAFARLPQEGGLEQLISCGTLLRVCRHEFLRTETQNTDTVSQQPVESYAAASTGTACSCRKACAHCRCVHLP